MALAAGGAVALATVALLAVHTPWTRARVLAWATGFLTRYDLTLQAGALDYNALTRRVVVTEVRLAAVGHEDAPFLVARRIEVRLPWAAYRGHFSIDRLDIDGGVVDIRRDAHDVTNLPPSDGGPAPATPRRLDVRGLGLHAFQIRYTDVLRDFDLRVPDIDADLANRAPGAGGLFAIRGNTALRVQDRTLTLAPTETQLAFDGSGVTFDGFRLKAAEVDVTVKGRVTRTLDAPALDLAFDGTTDVASAAAWVPPPVAVAGSVRIAGAITGPADEPTIDFTTSGDDLSVGLERGLRIAGPIRVTLDAVTSGGVTLTPATGGTLVASFTVPFGDAPSQARAEWHGVDARAALRLGEVAPQPLGSRLEGSLTFEASAPRRLQVANRATPSAGKGLVAVSGTLDGRLVGDRWTLDHAHHMDGLNVDGRVEGEIESGVGSPSTKLRASRESGAGGSTLAGNAHAQVLDVATAAASLSTFGITIPAIVRELHGAVDVPIVLSGSFADPRYQARLATEAVEVPSLGAVRGGANVEGSVRDVTVSSIDLARGTARVTGDVTANITKETLTGALQVNAPDASALEAALPDAWRLSGPIRATATLGGTFDAFFLDGTVEGQSLTFADQSVDSLVATGRVTAEAVDITSIDLREGAGAITGRLRYDWDAGSYTASLKGQGLTWTGSLLKEGDTHAVLQAQFDGAGTIDRPAGAGRIEFAVSGGTAGALVGSGDVTVDLLGDHARFMARAPSLGALVTGTVQTAAPYQYRATGAFNRVTLEPLAAMVDALEGGVLGAVSLSATASGALEGNTNPTVYANLQEIDVTVGGVPLALTAPAHLSLVDKRLTLDEVNMRVGAGRLSASGEWTDRLDGELKGTFDGALQELVRMGRAFGLPVTADATGAVSVVFRSNGQRAGTSATLAVRDATVGPTAESPVLRNLSLEATLDGDTLTMPRISGTVATAGILGDFSASGRARVPTFELKAVDGSLDLETASFTFSGLPVEQARPSRIELATGHVTLADMTWTVAGNPLNLSGTLDLSSERESPIEMSVTGLVDLRVLSAFAPTVGFDGTADLDARVTGTFEAPSLQGRITLADAELAISDPRMVLTELAGPIMLEGRTIRLGAITGLANGGKVAIGGSVEIDGRELSGGAIFINAEGVALEFPRGLRSEIDGLVTFVPDPKSPTVTGDIRVQRSAYTDTISLAALARRTAAPSVPVVAQPYLDRIRLNLGVTTTEDIVVDNNYGRFEAGANLRVVGTVAAPGMTGRVTMREAGSVYLAGRTFRLTRGDVSFTNLRRIEPEFNIAADARVGTDTVTMTLTGTLDHPSIDLTSEDGSKTSGELAAEIVGGGAGAGSALTLLSADVLGLTGRAIGLDALRVERGDYVDTDFREDPLLVANEADPATRLTIAKRVSSQVEVTLSQNLRESGKSTVIVSYFPWPNLELRGLSRDNATLGLGIRHQVTFGGGGQTPGSVRAARPTVVAVTFVDATPAVEADARKHIKLGPGDPLEFLDLQRDIDAVRDALHAQGRFEARVRVRRIEGEGGRGITLEYRVDPGPVTTLVVRGADLPASELKALQAAWTRTVFDPFLIDEVTTRVRRYLVTSGSIANIVVGTMERPSADAKRLRIDVTPGAPVTAREIRFLGNTAVSSDRLKAEVTGAGLDLEAWIDPSAVATAIQSLYRDAGYLKAAVTAGPLDIEDTTGVLPVRIVEGPQARISEVRFSGVAETRLAAARGAAMILPPSPFVSSAVSDARQRIADRYRLDGFNAAEVDAETAVGDGDAVVVTFAVVEGPQQVLQAVTTAGADHTNPNVVAEALRFSVGKPVNLDDWSVARKRLYDTNVFRRVDIDAQPVGDVVDGVQPVRAAVTVQEYPEWTLRYGFQLEGERTPSIEEFASKENFGVVAEVKNQNLFGRALTVGGFAQYQYDTQDANIFFGTSRLFGWRARSLLYSFVERQRLRDDADEISALADRIGASVEQRWRRNGVQVVYGYRYERNHTYDPDPSPIDPLPLDFTANLGRITAAVLWDRRDDPLNSRRGTFSSASWEQAADWLAADVTNRKLLLQQFYFAPMGRRLVLASRAQLGLVFGPDELLPSDRFRAGGATTVRGYGEGGLGPTDFFGLPEGGQSMVVLNEEARFTLSKWVGGVAFIDAGTITHQDESLSLGSLKVGYGGGLRLNTPVGLLRADVGIPADLVTPTSTRAANSLKSARWYVGIGHIF